MEWVLSFHLRPNQKWPCCRWLEPTKGGDILYHSFPYWMFTVWKPGFGFKLVPALIISFEKTFTNAFQIQVSALLVTHSRPLGSTTWKLTSKSVEGMEIASPGEVRKEGGAKGKRCGHQKPSCVQTIHVISSWASWRQLVREDCLCHRLGLAVTGTQMEKVSSSVSWASFFGLSLGITSLLLGVPGPLLGHVEDHRLLSLGTILQLLSSAFSHQNGLSTL